MPATAPDAARVRVWRDAWWRRDGDAGWIAVESQPTTAQWSAPPPSRGPELGPLARGALALSSGQPIAVLADDGKVYLFTNEWGSPGARQLVGESGPRALVALPPPPLIVVLRPHPVGMRGVNQSTEYVRQAIERDRMNGWLVPWVRRQIQAAHLPDPRGFPNADHVVAALFDAQKREMAFVKDPISGEMMANAADLLCLDPSGLCLRGGDCDDQLIVLGSAVASAGIPVRLCVRRYPGLPQAHIVLQYQSQGLWKCIDPSVDDGACSSAPYAEQIIVEIVGDPSESGVFLGLGGPMRDAGDGTLGAAGDQVMPADQAQGWLDQLAGARNALMRSRTRLAQNAAAFDAVRADLGLPQFDIPSSGPSETPSTGPLADYVRTGVWTQDAASARTRLLSTADYLVGAINDGLSGKRALTFANGDLFVASVPGDPYGVVVGTNAQGQRVPMFIDSQGNTTGTLGIVPIVIGAIVLGAVVVSLASAWAIGKYCDYLAQSHNDDALNKIATEQQTLVASGKATPDQALATVKALTDLDKANETKPSALGDVLASFPIISLIGAALAGGALGFGISRFVGSLGWFAGGGGGGRRASAAQPGRRHRYGRASAGRMYAERVRLSRGYDSTGRYWGVGTPLYRVSDAGGEIDAYVRAPNANEAKSRVLAPSAKRGARGDGSTSTGRRV
ncbi:MAG: hypothetical protein ACRDNM_06820 [Gaiellaceae bacterium]